MICAMDYVDKDQRSCGQMSPVLPAGVVGIGRAIVCTGKGSLSWELKVTELSLWKSDAGICFN
jgi:hypothetical protein